MIKELRSPLPSFVLSVSNTRTYFKNLNNAAKVKKIIFLLLLLAVNFSYSQNKQFIYEYRFIPDSTHKNEVKSEIMILNVSKEKSEFYSFEKYQTDSTLLADSKKGLWTMPPNKEIILDQVLKYPNSDQITYVTFMAWEKYLVKQNPKFHWKLDNEFLKILGYDTQKATADFGGRKWTAWFSKEIPIQDGPYKFRGLPGLILKVEDSDKNHVFELKGIKANEETFVYPDLNNFKEFSLSNDQYIKKFKSYRKNPTADLVGKIPDQRDAEGNIRTSTQALKELNDQWLERFSRDNNPIELNLLK